MLAAKTESLFTNPFLARRFFVFFSVHFYFALTSANHTLFRDVLGIFLYNIKELYLYFVNTERNSHMIFVKLHNI
jgi:hypothetical protein